MASSIHEAGSQWGSTNVNNNNVSTGALSSRDERKKSSTTSFGRPSSRRRARLCYGVINMNHDKSKISTGVGYRHPADSTPTCRKPLPTNAPKTPLSCTTRDGGCHTLWPRAPWRKPRNSPQRRQRAAKLLRAFHSSPPAPQHHAQLQKYASTHMSLPVSDPSASSAYSEHARLTDARSCACCPRGGEEAEASPGVAAVAAPASSSSPPSQPSGNP